MKIKIDREQCIGCGTCESICEEFFKLDKENKSNIKKNKQGELKEVGCAREAVKSCPTQCIRVE